jgi:hypothetical protein|tara:strand:+ start:144 stop:245 length:102 start_codon:yes stop_codon:yes gene_type:complete
LLVVEEVEQEVELVEVEQVVIEQLLVFLFLLAL